MFASLAFVAAIFAVQDSQPAQDSQVARQTCVLEGEGWVCRYKAPEGTVTLTPEDSVAAPAADKSRDITAREAARQARLVRRCADASWLSLCSPGDRKEAKAIRAANEAKAKLRVEVTTLAAHDQCPQAIQAALEGGDLALAREIKDFCAPAH